MKAEFYIGEDKFWTLQNWSNSTPPSGAKITFAIPTGDPGNPEIFFTGNVVDSAQVDGSTHIRINMDMGYMAEGLRTKKVRITRWTRLEPTKEK